MNARISSVHNFIDVITKVSLFLQIDKADTLSVNQLIQITSITRALRKGVPICKSVYSDN